MPKERLPIRVDPETAEALEEHAEEQDISKSEAGRRAIRSYLSQHGHPIATADGMGVTQIDEIAEQLDQVEQKQAARANMRFRVEVAQTVSIFALLVYLVAVVGFDASGPLWVFAGLTTILSTIVSYGWAFRLGRGE